MTSNGARLVVIGLMLTLGPLTGMAAARPGDLLPVTALIAGGVAVLLSALRWSAVRLALLFLACWVFGVEQYVFLPCVALYLLARLRQDAPPARDGRFVLLVTAAVAALGLLAFIRVDELSAIRTTAVWGSAALVLLAWRRSDHRGRDVVVATLVMVWVASLAVAFAASRAPGAAETLMNVRRPIAGLATNPGPVAPTVYLDRDWDRPVGFMLYANELALYGLLAAGLALVHWGHVRPRLTRLLVLLSLVGVVASSSRTLTVLMVGMVLAGAVVFAANRLVPGLGLIVGLALIPAVLAVLTVVDPLGHTQDALVNDFLGAREGSSDDDRAYSYRVGWYLYESHQWTGVGYLPQLGPIAAGSHSLPLSLGVRFGNPGFAAFVLLILPTAWMAVRAVLGRDARMAWLGIVGLIACAASSSIQFDDEAFVFTAFALAAVRLISPSRGDIVGDGAGGAGVGDLRRDVLIGGVPDH